MVKITDKRASTKTDIQPKERVARHSQPRAIDVFIEGRRFDATVTDGVVEVGEEGKAFAANLKATMPPDYEIHYSIVYETTF